MQKRIPKNKNTNTDIRFDKMGQESEEGEVGKARSCLLANTRITVGYTEKIYNIKEDTNTKH